MIDFSIFDIVNSELTVSFNLIKSYDYKPLPTLISALN